jgi:hypothetical protein
MMQKGEVRQMTYKVRSSDEPDLPAITAFTAWSTEHRARRLRVAQRKILETFIAYRAGLPVLYQFICMILEPEEPQKWMAASAGRGGHEGLHFMSRDKRS